MQEPGCRGRLWQTVADRDTCLPNIRTSRYYELEAICKQGKTDWRAASLYSPHSVRLDAHSLLNMLLPDDKFLPLLRDHLFVGNHPFHVIRNLVELIERCHALRLRYICPHCATVDPANL